ncbi:hypothetical protein [Microbispora sp. ATCC PTA-5024]|nr:hypothetical protein [Microbispora sp. ATCC PTA-5024]
MRGRPSVEAVTRGSTGVRLTEAGPALLSEARDVGVLGFRRAGMTAVHVP